MKGSRTSNYKDTHDPYQSKGKSAGPRHNPLSVSHVISGHGTTKARDNPTNNYGDLFSNLATKSITAKNGNMPLQVRNNGYQYDKRSNSAASSKAITKAVEEITRPQNGRLTGAFINKTLPVARKQTIATDDLRPSREANTPMQSFTVKQANDTLQNSGKKDPYAKVE